MTDIATLVNAIVPAAPTDKPPLPDPGPERLQMQWGELTRKAFDFAKIAKLLNLAKSLGGSAKTLTAVMDEVHLTGKPVRNLADMLETKLRGRLSITTTPVEDGARQGHTTVYNKAEPTAKETANNRINGFAFMVGMMRSLGVRRTVSVLDVEVPMLEVTQRNNRTYIGGIDARDYYRQQTDHGTSGESLQNAKGHGGRVGH
tara:strand:- start:1311 stop:1916 length:606 start_codon:yes stop_codon:yes gene_type:complete